MSICIIHNLIWTTILIHLTTAALDEGCILAESHALGGAVSL